MSTSTARAARAATSGAPKRSPARGRSNATSEADTSLLVPSSPVVTVAPGSHGHRFDMQQNGRKMTAEEFDAWMKARGIRVAKGAPTRPKAPTTARRAR